MNNIFVPLLFACLLPSVSALSRSGFPVGFIFGTASSAYQYEGAAMEGDKGSSIWDTFTHQYPEKIEDRSNGDVAVDSYHHYKDDVKLVKEMGMDAYKFSISWPRILPNGNIIGGINPKGITYYNNLINYVLSNGIKPYVTLFHWDTPQNLEDSYGGFLSEKITKDFRGYAEVCFLEFGDRVKHWFTFNEPCNYCSNGYGSGGKAPGRCSSSVSESCPEGDSGREPYTTAHNMLLAHAEVVKLYREKYRGFQRGSIGIILNSHWYVPFSNSQSDRDATQRALDFNFGWLMDPLTHGEYPSTMRDLVGERLPKFTANQSNMLKGSFDFLGINYYTSNYVLNVALSSQVNVTYFSDSCTNTTGFRDGKPIGPQAGSSWLFMYPQGLKELLLYIKNKYNNPVIYISENGVDEANSDTLSLKEALEDNMRIMYHKSHLLYLQQAIRNGVDVRGYFAWSLLDNFEWVAGYTVRFGLNYVDFKDGLKRYPKKSAQWFRDFLKHHNYAQKYYSSQ